MREVFGQYYQPDGDGLGRFVTTATVIPDANVLLGLYRLPASEREQVFGVLQKIQDRLWLPYQAGDEYQRNRLSVVAQQARNYEQAREIHGIRGLDDMQKYLRSLNLPDEVREKIEGWLPELVTSIRSAVANFEASVEFLTDEHVVTVSQARSNDPVRERLDALFPSSQVGRRPTTETLEARIKEALRRFAAKIPPGYKDAEKATDDQKAGDFLIWAEILEYAKDSDRPVLFVTSDRKEDWFARFGGEVQGPRPELVMEFAAHSEHGYHQVTLADFLDLANTYLSTTVDRATIQRVGEPRTVALTAEDLADIQMDLLWGLRKTPEGSLSDYTRDLLDALSSEERNRLVHRARPWGSDIKFFPLIRPKGDAANLDPADQAAIERWFSQSYLTESNEEPRGDGKPPEPEADTGQL